MINIFGAGDGTQARDIKLWDSVMKVNYSHYV